LVKAYQEWKNDGKVSGKTEFIYGKFEEFIKSSEGTLTGIYADLKNYKKQLLTKADEETDKKLIPLFKLFSPEHLTKKSFANDSNSLDKGFYNELLHILGLQEVKEGSKRLIQRLPEDERNPGSLVENTIATLKYDQHMNEVRDAKIQYGDGEDDQLFGVALELVITWMNRVLFLKLLEAQLLAYHQLDPKFKFLVFEGIIDEYDELNKLFFRVLALKNNERPESLQKRFGHIPYLNSSLFDSTNLEKATIQISGLDDKASIPIYNKSVFRKSANPPKGSLNTLEYLLRFLDAYNFSAESSGGIQTEDKALINASVLGLIFEKINGYKDGSFFTPGFITEYMARETLRKSVMDKLNEAFDWDCKEFNELHRKVENKSLDEVNAVINSITICDPAVGSGHFLVSCLNELLAIKAELKVLCDVEGKRIPYLDIEVENDELAIEHNGELFEYKVNHEWKNDNVERSHAGKERQRIQEALFHEKRFLIEHCLFGVDINPNSVKICRLRLWIELLKHAYYKESGSTQTLKQVQGDASVEEDKRKASHPDPEGSGDGSAQSGTSYNPYSELEVLPNIDINIKQGNSLVSRFGLDEDLTSIFKKSEHSLEDYKQAVKNYRETRDRNEKQRLQKLIDDIKAEYSETLLNNKPINKKLSKERGKLELMQNEDLFGGGKATKKELTAQQKKVSKLEEQKAEEEAGAFYREAFEWRFEFPEVLDDQGNYTGFDIVIGNPPYVRQEELGNLKPFLKTHFAVFAGTADLYTYFIEQGLKLNKENGYFHYIVANKWMRANYGKPLRTWLREKKITSITDFGDLPVFEEATTYPCLLEIKNNEKATVFKALEVESLPVEDFDMLEEEKGFEVDATKLSEEGWSLVPFKTQQLLEKLKKTGTPLGEYVDGKIYRGVLTGYNDAFIIDEEIKDQLIKEDASNGELIKPFLAGRDIKRYQVPKPSNYLIFTRRGTDIDKYPAIKRYLKGFKKQLEPRPKDIPNSEWFGRKPGSYEWYEIQDAVDYYEEFEKEKIVWPETSLENQFCMVKSGHYLNKTTFFIPIENDSLLGLLNSKLAGFYFGSIVSKMRGGYFSMSKAYVETFHIISKSSLNKKISKKSTQILAAKKENPEADTSELEAEIDQMVYELYGLTEEEIAIVEENLG